ncbi:ExbD/TolR family protein [Undibacterium crateris]|uniref:ExbD/TolR family protein n=1 Tax=Undibacterium crateris TaxID=2528175 RepID=UPI00138A325C|nr:biopolymer transporter ExbD [Undibacterium crateris]NDI86115.1 biopolymer transporter ExbD [Undibacterium crateris]
MSIGRFSQTGSSAQENNSALADINVTPMVDVMLVLLVIFIMAAPLMLPAIQLELPATQARPAPAPAVTVQIAIAADQSLYWGGSRISAEELPVRLQTQARQSPQTVISLQADRATPYEQLAKVMAAAQAAGLNQISFVTDSTQPARP